MTSSTVTKPPYSQPKPLNGHASDKKHNEIATSSLFGPQFADNLDGSTVVVSGIQTRKYYVLARTNPEVRMAIKTLSQATFWVESQLQPQNDYERHPRFRALDETILEMMNAQLVRIGNFHRILRELFVFALRCGFAVAEKNWEAIGDTWAMTSLKVKKPWDFEPVVDELGELYQLFHYPTGQYLNPRKFVYAPWPGRGADNWLGEPEMEALLHDVELLQKSEAALAKNAHLLSRRTLIHRYNAMRSDKELDAAKRAVKQIDEGEMPQFPTILDDKDKLIVQDELSVMEDRTSSLAMPKLAEISVMEANRIKRAIGVPDDLGSTDTKFGSRARAGVHFDMLMAGANDGQDWTSELVENQIVADMLEFNYPNLPLSYLPPKWVPAEIEEKYSLDRAEYWQRLIDMDLLDPTAPIIAQDLGVPLNQVKQKSGNDEFAANRDLRNLAKLDGPKRGLWRYLLRDR